MNNYWLKLDIWNNIKSWWKNLFVKKVMWEFWSYLKFNNYFKKGKWVSLILF